MVKVIRQIILTLAASAGVIAAATLPAAAGLALPNHCVPPPP